jgi:hypothetical protein
MTDLYYVELDVYDDTDLSQQCEEYGIIGEEIKPGRNWPMWKYTGTYDKLKKFVDEVYQDDLTDYFVKVS